MQRGYGGRALGCKGDVLRAGLLGSPQWWQALQTGAAEALPALVAAVMLVIWCQAVLLDRPGPAPDRRASATGGQHGARAAIDEPGRVIGGYIGVPYTLPSDVRFTNPGKTDMTVHDVNWDGRPFKSPIYYGLRAQNWAAGGAGAMIDFTHSKTISQREQSVRLSGTRNGAPVRPSTTIGETFKHFEFSHGHNMLTLNGLYRLGAWTPAIGPYVGAGIGVSLPHTEVQFQDEPTRTYEYQYTGPVVQALAGVELRLPRASVYVEYKFTLAWYRAPMSGRSNPGWGFGDFGLQFMSWWRGEAPLFGWLSTTLASHQVIGGVGLRLPAGAAAVP